MRLLNTTTLEFEEFAGGLTEKYTILSHRWGDEEVSFKEYRKSRETLKHRAGYKKITQFCKISRQRGYRLAWIDTCCIDKRSSAELSEAINSMYEWYRISAECYVWLEDYSGSLDDLHKCAWFSRGWTLQEMLAPRRVIFFTAHWKIIGHKICIERFTLIVWSKHSHECPCMERRTTSPLGRHIIRWLVEASGIPEEYLSGVPVNKASIAERMSWAYRRKTTRVEDQAYSLLGLFEINMPLLYGEGHTAFRRLQEEILRRSDDTSIFCSNHHALLAHSPVQFINCGGVTKGRIRSSEPYSVTNRGLKLCATARRGKVMNASRSETQDNHIYRIDLGCKLPDPQPSVSWTASMGTLAPPEPSVARYLYLRCEDQHQFRRTRYNPNIASRVVLDWVDLGEETFFVSI
jgi:hypothetical protein